MKHYPQHEPDADYKRRLGDAAKAALQRREAQRQLREVQSEIRDGFVTDDDLAEGPTKDEVDKVIAEHQQGVDEVMQGQDVETYIRHKCSGSYQSFCRLAFIYTSLLRLLRSRLVERRLGKCKLGGMQMQKKTGFRPNWLPSGNTPGTSQSDSKTRLTHSTLLVPVRLSCALMLMLLGSLLIGCAAPPTPLLREPKPITQPVLSQPLPSVTYSASVSKNTASWEKRLTDTSTISK